MTNYVVGGRKIKKYRLIIGIVILIVGIVGSLQFFNIWNFFPSNLTFGGLGMSLSTTRYMWLPFSTLSPGVAYKWTSTVTNTGTLPWSTGWINVRLGINGATAVQTSCALNPASCSGGTVVGNFYVDKCSGQIDVVACREDFVPTWAFKWSADGTTWNTGCTGTYPGSTAAANYNNKVCSIDIGTVGPSSTKTIYYQLTLPTSYPSSGSWPFMTQLMAYNAGTYGVVGSTDTISVLPAGAISGTMSLQLVGMMSLIAGLAIVISSLV